LQAEIDGVFTGGDDLAGAIEEVARLGARLLLKTAIEAEVTALFLGRERYERAASRVRHSNFIERTFGETRRRVKVIGRLPGEHSCLKLVWAVLDRASTGWRGFTMTPAGLRLLAGAAHCTTRRPKLPQRNSKNHAETGVAPTDSVAIASNHDRKRAEPTSGHFYTAPGTPPLAARSPPSCHNFPTENWSTRPRSRLNNSSWAISSRLCFSTFNSPLRHTRKTEYAPASR
jgi:Transposase, Mutator family